MKKNKKKKWLKPRHRVVRNILNVTLGPVCCIKYRCRIERFKEQEKRPYLILFNHQTSFDQFFVGMAFKRPIYYLATEDIFSNGFVSSLIRFLVEPIPIKKQTTDIKAILNCMRVSREGGTIALAPEGNRTYSGRTEYINPSIVPLARKLGVPVVLYRIEGGYGVEPRWGKKPRKGKMHCYVGRVLQPEEYTSMSDDELYRAICEGLYVDEAVADASYKSSRPAECMERAIYVCEDCGLSTFRSHKDIIECQKCHKRIRYTADKRLVGVDAPTKFNFVADWYDYQKDFMNATDVTAMTNEPIYSEWSSFSEVIPCQKKIKMAKCASVSLYGNKIVVSYGDTQNEFSFDSVNAVTVLGRNKLNIYHDGHIYQLKSSKEFNALKYVHVFHRYKNIVKGDNGNAFLGL